jgi:hypothetical protein
MTLTFTGLNPSSQYRFQFGYGDFRTIYNYNETATLTLSSGAPVPVQLAYGSAAAGDEYALLTATVSNTTSLVLTLPQTVSGFHGPMQAGFSVHQIAPSGYNAWAAANAGGQSAGGDHDGDGVKNLVEYALADGQERGTLSGNVLTFTKRGLPYGTDLAYIIETSETLVGAWTDAVTHGPGLLVSNPTISYTFTPGTPAKKFARLKVTSP